MNSDYQPPRKLHTLRDKGSKPKRFKSFYGCALSQEYFKRETIHHLSDTLALLGAGEKMVEMLRQVEEKPFTPEFIDEIRKFNAERITDVKMRLVLLNTTSFVK